MNRPQIVEEREMPADLDAAIRDALCECFPPDREVFSRTRAWHGCLPAWSAVLRHEDAVIAHAGIVQRTVLVGPQPVRVAGVQNVLVMPAYRGQGLFRAVMDAVVAEAIRRGDELGMLFCTPDIGRLYQRIGWRVAEDRQVTRVDEDGHLRPLPEKNITLYCSLRLADLPSGEIHLQGNDW